MTVSRHPSPLPPDQSTVARGSPLPSNLAATAAGSPLPSNLAATAASSASTGLCQGSIRSGCGRTHDRLAGGGHPEPRAPLTTRTKGPGPSDALGPGFLLDRISPAS